MVSRKGFVYDVVSRASPGNTSPELSSYPNVVDEGTLVNGTFDSAVLGLDYNTTYYYRAFGYDDVEDVYVYGDELSFTTLDPPLYTAFFDQGDVLQSKVVAKIRSAITSVLCSELNYTGTKPTLEVSNNNGGSWQEVQVGVRHNFTSSSTEDALKYRITATNGSCVVSAPIKIQIN